MISSIGNPKESAKKLKVRFEFHKVSWYKIKIRNQVYFYTLAMNNLKIKLRKTTLFTTSSKGIKYLGIEFAKSARVVHWELQIIVEKLKSI